MRSFFVLAQQKYLHSNAIRAQSFLCELSAKKIDMLRTVTKVAKKIQKIYDNGIIYLRLLHSFACYYPVSLKSFI